MGFLVRRGREKKEWAEEAHPDQPSLSMRKIQHHYAFPRVFIAYTVELTRTVGHSSTVCMNETTFREKFF